MRVVTSVVGCYHDERKEKDMEVPRNQVRLKNVHCLVWWKLTSKHFCKLIGLIEQEA